MTAKIPVKTFLDVESVLGTTLSTAWDSYSTPIVKKIIRYAENGEYGEAIDLIGSISFSKALEKSRDQIAFSTAAAFMFGVSRLSSLKKAKSSGKPIPKEKEAISHFNDILELIAIPYIKKQALQLIAKEEVDKTVRKVDIVKPFVSSMGAVINGIGKDYSFLVSSLHSSRMAAWGFLTEAELLDVSEYAVSEQLDGRTCPVCSIMNGKVFTTTKARSRLEAIFSTTNVADIKVLAPWVKQDKDSVDALKKMTTSELVEKGWDTPPYHPFCRGLLVHVKDSPITPEALSDSFNSPDLDLLSTLIAQSFADASNAASLSPLAVADTVSPLLSLVELTQSADEFVMLVEGESASISASNLAATLKGIDSSKVISQDTFFVDSDWSLNKIITPEGKAPTSLTGSEPPVVLGNDGNLISGTERVLYALSKGESSIKSYVPAKEYWTKTKLNM